MPDESLDQLIRRKIDNLHVPFQEHDWAVFWNRHLKPVINEHSFDALIAQSLTSVELEPDQHDWSLLEAMLPADAPILSIQSGTPTSPEPPAPELPDSAFDLALSQQLESANLPFQEADWTLMASQLDGNPFDQAVRSSLSNLEVPFQPVDWREMSEHLDAPMYESMRQHLGTMELSFRHADWRMFSRQWLGYRRWQVQWRDLVAAAAVILLLLSVFLPDNNSPQLAQQPQQSLFQDQEDHSNTSEGEAIVDQGSSFSESTAALSPSTPAPSANSPSVHRSGHGFDFAVLQALPDIAISDADVTEEQPVTTVGEEQEVYSLQPVSGRELFFEVADLAFPMKAPSWVDWLPRRKQLYSLSIGLYGAYGNTRAELSSLNKTPGFASGLRVEIGLSEQVSLITGIQYEERGFSHRYFAYTPSQVRVENVVEADLQLAEVPLFLRYYIPVAERVRLYGQSGVLAMVSLRENYQLFQKRSTLVPVPSVDGNNLRLADPAGGQRRSLETYVGNLYGSVGLDVHIAKHLHLQIEPYTVISLQKTKGSGALGVEKRMYHGGIGASLLYNLQ